jgi:hypothetical protein
MAKLARGLYETLITEALAERLAHGDDDAAAAKAAWGRRRASDVRGSCQSK